MKFIFPLGITDTVGKLSHDSDSKSLEEKWALT